MHPDLIVHPALRARRSEGLDEAPHERLVWLMPEVRVPLQADHARPANK
jgi:hypothetical protein